MRKLSCIFFFFSATLSFSQKPFFQSYSLLKKNERVNVNVIFQDKVGFIWFGTDKGLFKFDGLKYQNFTSLNGLPDNHVTAINQDSSGRIWTGHQTGEIAILENESIKKFEPQEGHSSKEISDIVFDKQGHLWFSTLDDGLYYFLNERLFRLDEIDGMPDLFVYDIEVDEDGKIWAGTDRGVAVCQLSGDQVKLSVLNNATGLPDNIIKKLVAKKDKIWMATEDAGLVSYDRQTSIFKKEIPDWNDGSITDMVIDGDEAILSLAQHGMVVYDWGTGIKKKIDKKNDLGFVNVNTLIKDREGNIWLGCAESVIRMPNHFIEYLEVYDGSKNENVSCLAVDRHENVWYSINGKLYVENTQELTAPDPSPWLTGKTWEGAYVSSVYVDSTGFVWVGFLGQGLIKINPLTHRLFRFDELNKTTVLSITGRGSSVWVASLSGAIQIKSKGERETLNFFNKSNGLSSDYIYQVFIDSQQRIWFGTDGKGVDMLDGSGIHHFQDGFSSKVVYGFAEDGLHRIWVNVQSDGLYEFNNSKFVPIMASNNQWSANEISCLASDKYGNLVVMHELGIDFFDIKRNNVFHFGDEIGLDNFKPNLNSVAADGHGGIYFGTSHGIIRYTPRMNDEKLFPTPFIDYLKVAGRKVFPKDKLVFSYHEKEITINYNGFWYQNIDKVHFQYQLTELDKNWIDSRDQTATYSGLQPGNYSFHLKATDSTFPNPEEAVINFIIEPPFWKTPLFIVSSVLSLLFLIYAIIKYRERTLLKEKHELEERVEERTQEIKKKNEEIQAQAEEISGINENLEALVRKRTIELERKNKALEEYAFINAHQLRAPLASILGLINILNTIELNPRDKIILEHLNDSSEKLEQIVRTITEAIERGDHEHFETGEPIG